MPKRLATEDEIIRRYYPKLPSWEVADLVGRSRGWVQKRAQLLGVKYRGKRVYREPMSGNNQFSGDPWIAEDYEPPHKPEPTKVLIGPGRVEVYRQRVESGEELWHADDSRQYSRDARTKDHMTHI